MTEFEQALESAVKTAEFFEGDEILMSGALLIECAELVQKQAAEIEALQDRNKQLQSKLLDARLAGDRTRIDPQVDALRTGDPCGRSCEGQAYRIEARTEKARADELQKEVDALTAERHRGLSHDALNKRIDSYFA